MKLWKSDLLETDDVWITVSYFMKITIGSVLEYLIPNSYYMQLVWAKYLYFYKGNNSCRTKRFILLAEPFLYFSFGFYYLGLLWEKIFYISFGFSRCCCMFLYKTFWNLYKTEYFLYKRRRRSLYVFQDFFRSVGIIFMFFPDRGKKFFSQFSSFSHFFRDFPAGKSAFSGMNFPSDRIFSPFSGSIFRSIRQEFSPFRIFLHAPDARALARA